MANVQLAVAGDETTQVILSVPGVQGPAGSNLPPSGTTHQLLYKQSNTDYDTAWKLITNDNVDAAAAIAGTKISPNFGSQNVLTTGTSTAASFIPSSSSVPTNGLYLPSANNVALSTNGTGRLFVDASGNVGVGTSIPENYGGGFATLEARGLSGTAGGIFQTRSFDASVKGYFYVDSSTNTGRIGTVTNHPFLLATSSQERLRITSAGLVGIGTSSPAVPLNISSSANGTPATSGTTQTHGSFRIGSSATSGCIDFGPNGQNPWIQATDRTNLSQNYNLLLNPNGGRVGIGTTSPGAKLTVVEGTANTSMLNLVGLNNYIHEFQNRDAGNHLRFYINSGSPTWSWASNATEFARIDSSGRLLVGTSTSITAPDALGSNRDGSLQLAGNLLATTMQGNHFFNVSGTGPLYQFTKSNASTIGNHTIVALNDRLGTFQWSGSDGTNYIPAAQIYAQIDGTPGTNDMPGRLVFSTTADGAASPTERMRITSAGLVGIGTSSPSTKLSVIGAATGLANGAIRTNTTGGTQSANSGLWLCGNQATTHYNWLIASQYNVGGALEITPSTAVDGATFTTPTAVFTQTGRVGIGTTSPGALFDLAANNDGATGTTANNTFRFTDLDTNTAADQPIGKIEWYSADTSSPGARAVSYILSAAAGANSGGDIRFGVSANAGSASEAARIDSSGRLLVGTSSTSAAATALFQGSSGAGVIYCTSSSATPADGAFIGAINVGDSSHDTSAQIGIQRDGGTWSASSQPTRLTFSTTADGASSPTERMRISANGDISFFNGTNAPLHFEGSTSTSTYTCYHRRDDTAYTIAQGSNGRVLRLGSGSGWQTTGVNLAAGATSWGTYSDERLKRDIVQLGNTLATLDGIRCITYRLDTDERDSKKRLGVVAQDLIGKYDEALNQSKRTEDDPTEYYSVQYSDLVPVLLSALQEAKQRIETLEAKVAALETV